MRNLPRLLAVDDDVASAELIVRVAERCGYDGFATSDSRGVTNLVNALQPSVMAIDITMPNIDAVGLMKLLAEAGYRGHIFICSGRDPEILEQVQAEGRELGLSIPFVIQKPVDFSALREILKAEDLKAAA